MAKLVYDGFLSLEGGVNGGQPPGTLESIQAARAVNLTFRGGYPRPRPKARKLEFTLGAGVGVALTDDKFQGAGSYVDRDGNGYVFLALSGELYLFPLSGVVPDATRITSLAVASNPNRERMWFCQAESYLVIQDGQSRAFVWDGISLNRSAEGQIPVGTRMAYGLGRLWVVQGRGYVGSDLVNSDPVKGEQSVLYFTENSYIANGGSFRVPFQSSEITGLSFTAKQDTAAGQGSLMIFTRGGVFEFDAPVDRTLWSETTQPLQRFALLGFGSVSHESIVQVNGDLFFRAEDGVRSFYHADREFGQWGNTPISREVSQALAYDNPVLRAFCSAANFDNRLLATAEPQITTRGVRHKRVVALDFDLISGMRGKLPPAWDGEWTFSFDVLQVLTVDTSAGRRCILVGIEDGEIGLYELAYDRNDSHVAESFDWQLDSKGFQAGLPTVPKRIRSANTWLDSVQGTLNLDAWYRADNSGCWVPWARYAKTVDHCVTELGCEPPVFPQPKGASRVGFGDAPAAESDCEPGQVGFEFQLRLKGNSQATLKRLMVSFQVLEQTQYGEMTNSCTALPEDCTTC